MARLCVRPEYRERLAALGLRAHADFLKLSGIIVSGHPDRHVVRVEIERTWTVFLKRHHRVSIGQRWKNWWAGFGLVSTAVREYQLLEALQVAGIGCPQPIAAGEDDQGQGFVLLEEVAGAQELPRVLATLDVRDRRKLAHRLGHALARLHEAGFDQPDLYSKHVLVAPDGALVFLDWQRSRRGQVSWDRRQRDLAALDATLTDELAGPRERLIFLRAYLREHCQPGARATDRRRPSLALRAAKDIRRRAKKLLQKRRIRECRQSVSNAPDAQVVWLNGERLCVTADFLARRDKVASTTWGRLVCNTYWRPFAWLRRFTTPEVRQAGQLFRNRRQGHRAPKVLAFGQHLEKPWRVSAFLLTEDPERTGA